MFELRKPGTNPDRIPGCELGWYDLETLGPASTTFANQIALSFFPAMESDDPKEALAKIVMEAEKTTDVKERLLKEIQEQFDEMMANEMGQKKKARQRRIGS